MSVPSNRELLNRTADSLDRAPGNRRLALVYGAGLLLASLVVGLIGMLQEFIPIPDGLAGIRMSSNLSSAESFLDFVVNLLLPFWSLGYAAATLMLARGHNPVTSTLLEGFRKLFPALRLFLLREGMLMAVGVACVFLGGTLLSLTPLANRMYELMMPVMLQGADPTTLDPAALREAMMPVFAGTMILMLVVIIPLSYRIRLAEYALLDDPMAGALSALRTSFRLTKGTCLRLFRLDLQFWWFYALQGLLMALAFGDVLLSLVGVDLIFPGSSLVFSTAAMALQLGLITWQLNRVHTAYAHAYLSLLAILP